MLPESDKSVWRFHAVNSTAVCFLWQLKAIKSNYYPDFSPEWVECCAKEGFSPALQQKPARMECQSLGGTSTSSSAVYRSALPIELVLRLHLAGVPGSIPAYEDGAQPCEVIPARCALPISRISWPLGA